MKKVIYLVLALMFMASPVLAKDKATVSLGSIKFKSTSNSQGGNSVAAANIGSTVQIAIGGSQGTSSGVLTVFLSNATVAALAKGQKLDVISSGNSDNDSAAQIVFLGTSVKINGFNSTTTGVASNNDTVASGKLTVVAYNSDTRELKFSLAATAKPYTKSTSKLGSSPVNKDLNSPLKVKANVIVTLP